MKRHDKKLWHAASTLADIGELTAQWLEGRIASHPACYGGPDEETHHLIPVLVRLNRAGWVTDCSQPGWGPGPTSRGTVWAQRAGVSGFASPDIANIIAKAATKAGMLVSATTVGPRRPRDGITVTTRDGKPYTGFGGRTPRRDVEFQYECCSDAAIRALCDVVQLAVVDPVWGRDDALWPLLIRFCGG